MEYALYDEIDLFPRNKIQEGNKKIGEVLEWYEEVNSQTLNYVTFSIHDSDISDFYRYVWKSKYRHTPLVFIVEYTT